MIPDTGVGGDFPDRALVQGWNAKGCHAFQTRGQSGWDAHHLPDGRGGFSWCGWLGGCLLPPSPLHQHPSQNVHSVKEMPTDTDGSYVKGICVAGLTSRTSRQSSRVWHVPTLLLLSPCPFTTKLPGCWGRAANAFFRTALSTLLDFQHLCRHWSLHWLSFTETRGFSGESWQQPSSEG